MQTKDEDQIRQVIQRWGEAWNDHDMTAMATLVSDDADFVNVWGMHWRGRAQIEREHAERHRAQFKESVWTTREARVQFLRPDVALVHLTWSMAGGRDPDGTPRPPREGLFTWIMLKEPGKWRIRAAHNTNVTPQK
jgi:uncharacterized protein (TIGR02246 family)